MRHFRGVMEPIRRLRGASLRTRFQNIALARIARRLVVLVPIFALGGLTACASLIDPCKTSEGGAVQGLSTFSTLLSNSSWDLLSIDGATIPPTGFVVTGRPERVYGGSLAFNTDNWWGNKRCTDVFESVGAVIGSYDVHVPSETSALQTVAGRFNAKHEQGIVIFYAGSATKDATLGSRDASLRRSITADVKIKKLGDRIFRVVFRER